MGGHPFNLDGMTDRIRVDSSDLRDESAMDRLVADREIIFNLAGNVSHIDSMRDPHTDLEVNCRSHLSLLQACRHHNPRAKVVYASTRQIYGHARFLPVTEEHLVRPVDVNGINKAAGEYYHLAYNDIFGIRACSLRLTNIYGPRQLIKHHRQGFIGWFIRLAVEDGEITVYGDGVQIRDSVYVDDAVDAFLRAGAADVCSGRVFYVGGSRPISIRELVALLIDVAGTGRLRFVEWPEGRKAIEIGDFYMDSKRLREAVGWQPQVPLREGLSRTLAYYRNYLSHYLDLAAEERGRTPTRVVEGS
jgi:UDP-glucose 4-epimerase